MTVTQAQVAAGQAIYSKNVLRIYNSFVLGFSNQFLWRCPTHHLLANYQRNISANHLDIGVGTGYFLERALARVSNPRLAIMDLNPTVLEYCSAKIRHYHPEVYNHNILEPLPPNIKKFDSVGINYLLHCLPGSLASNKASIFDHLKAVMNPGATIFGSTLLNDLPKNWLTKTWMGAYNRKGIFSVLDDHLPDLESALHRHFTNVKIDLVGSVGIFSAIQPAQVTRV